MDEISKHWAVYPRRFPTICPVQSIGDMTGKDHWIHHAFSSCNFSLILKGEGEFHRKNRCWKVQAPCVITQWPGERVHYGPQKPKGTWDELYLIYDSQYMTWFRQRGFVDKDRPVWPIHNLQNVLTQVEELRALTQSRHPELMADRVDSVCDRLLLETLLPADEAGDSVVQQLVTEMKKRTQDPHDFNHFARRHGMSGSTLRRRWLESIHVSPRRYLLELRIQKARRLLAETTLHIGEIADLAGFPDRLYFSRRFHVETKLTPSQYRRRYRIRTPGDKSSPLK